MNQNQTFEYELLLGFSSARPSWKLHRARKRRLSAKPRSRGSDGRGGWTYRTAEEIHAEPEDVCAYISTEISKLLATPGFLDALPGYLLPDQASQGHLDIAGAIEKDNRYSIEIVRPGIKARGWHNSVTQPNLCGQVARTEN
jgi:hypothetical protein